MSLDPAFLEFMPHTISVYEWSGYNEYAEPAYSSTPAIYPAMIEQRPDVVRTSYGDEVISSHVVYVASTSPIAMTSKVVLNDGTTSPPEPPMVRADAFSDETGAVHHVVLFFGSGASGG